MTEAFFATAVLSASLAIGHATLGEHLILVPLARQTDLPKTRLGGRATTLRVLRFTWHFFSAVMAGLAVGFLLLATDAIGGGDWALVRALAVCFGVFGVLVLVLSRGRHFAWLLGLGAAATAWAGTL